MVSFSSGKYFWVPASFLRDRGVESAEWRDRLDRIIRAERQRHAGSEKRTPSVGTYGAFRAEAFDRPVHVGEQVVRLHGGYDTQLREAIDLVGASLQNNRHASAMFARSQ
jgi:hypothetical protein